MRRCDRRAVVLVAGEGLQLGVEVGELAGDATAASRSSCDLGRGFRVGELFGLVLGLAAERPRHHPRVGGLGRVVGDAVGDQPALRGEGAERFDPAGQLVAARPPQPAASASAVSGTPAILAALAFARSPVTPADGRRNSRRAGGSPPAPGSSTVRATEDTARHYGTGDALALFQLEQDASVAEQDVATEVFHLEPQDPS